MDYCLSEKQIKIKLKKICSNSNKHYVLIIEIRSFYFTAYAIQEIRPGNVSSPFWILKCLHPQDKKINITPGQH